MCVCIYMSLRVHTCMLVEAAVDARYVLHCLYLILHFPYLSFYYILKSMCMYCVTGVCTRACMCVSPWMHVSQNNLWESVLSFHYQAWGKHLLPIYFETRSPPWIWNLPLRLGRLDSKPQGLFLLCLPSIGVSGMHVGTWLFYLGLGEPN